ncbi:MAG: tetratricopeptide repeat protein [Nitrososphaerota archaeon]
MLPNFNKGNALFQLDKLDQAIKEFDSALKLNPNYINALNNKGAILSSLGSCKEDIICYDRILEIDPDHRYALYNKTKCLSETKKVIKDK